MIDFNHRAYLKYITAIKNSFKNIMRFDEFLITDKKLDSLCLIRHDVDRKPKNALIMAKLEKRMGITSTYYFRSKNHTFIPEIIKQIHNYGHEIGYHYESLSDKKGRMDEALEDFKIQLDKFRKIVPINTISMHGKPLSQFDNRNMWKNQKNHNKLISEFGILGEIYLDIDYSDIVYISDTGRNWSQNKNNVRDKVLTDQRLNFYNGSDLLNYLWTDKIKKLIFLVHPDRWNNSVLEYIIQYCYDKSINLAKNVYK